MSDGESFVALGAVRPCRRQWLDDKGVAPCQFGREERISLHRLNVALSSLYNALVSSLSLGHDYIQNIIFEIDFLCLSRYDLVDRL